jgi:hypothetical protein
LVEGRFHELRAVQHWFSNQPWSRADGTSFSLRRSATGPPEIDQMCVKPAWKRLYAFVNNNFYRS